MESMLRPVPSLASLLDDGDARKRRIARLSHERELARDAEVYRGELARQLARLDRRLERIRGVFPVWAPAQTKADRTKADRTKARAAGANKVDAKERARARMAARYAALVTSDGANVNVNVT
jgi:hypothetical protein